NTHLALSPDGRYALERVIGREVFELRVWDTAKGQPLALHRRRRGYTWEQFSPEGSRILTCADEPDVAAGRASPVRWGEARIWDAAPGQALTPPLKHDKVVRHAEFSADGRRVVTASADQTARVWDATTGRALTTSLPHSYLVFFAAFSSDGRRVV